MYLLSISPILEIVDVEGKGAGDSEGQVGDGGHEVHPGWPEEVLQIGVDHVRCLHHVPT